MNDLLHAVKDTTASPTYGARRAPSGAGGDLEAGYYGSGGGGGAAAAGAGGAGAADPDMQLFFAKTKDVQQLMQQIRARQHELWQMHEHSKGIVRRREITEHRARMQAAANEVNAVAHRIKGEIAALDQLNAQALGKRGQGPGSASERTRTSITAGLKKKLKDLMGEFSDLRARIHEENRQVVERRVYTVTGQRLPEEDIDRMIETGEAETIFQKAILEQGRGRVLDTLAEIQERNRAVKDLEASLLELHQIFLDMAVLVEAQGEMLDNIEKQVGRAVDYVGGGTKALVEAKALQKSKRKWCCCAIVTLLVIVAIVIAVVVVVYVLPNIQKAKAAQQQQQQQQQAAPAPSPSPAPPPKLAPAPAPAPQPKALAAEPVEPPPPAAAAAAPPPPKPQAAKAAQQQQPLSAQQQAQQAAAAAGRNLLAYAVAALAAANDAGVLGAAIGGGW